MSRQLNLISSPEPGAPKHSGRLAGEVVTNAPEEPAGRSTGSHSCGGRTPARQSGALAGDATARANQRPSPSISPSDFIEATPEIPFDQLRPGDQIVIQTAHSAYIFLVRDPARRLGMVVGGVFGNYAAEAYLEVLSVADDFRRRAGACAIFYVTSGAECRRVRTSVITCLIYRRAETAPLS